MFYGIAFFPSTEIEEFATPYRKRYDPHVSLIRPHLTLREKEEWSEERLAEALSGLQSVAEAVKPFELHFNRFSSFSPASPVIYMALEDPLPMRLLHQKICCGPLAMQEARPYAYVPHLTIAQELPHDELHDVLASLKKQPIHLSCTVDHFTLVRQESSGVWSPVREFMLS